WLDADGRHRELAALIRDAFDRAAPTAADVDFVCGLNERHRFDAVRHDLPQREGDAAHAALLACLGSDEARARVLEALVGDGEADVRIAQVYLRHRPVTDPDALRDLAAAIATMSDPAAQSRALQALGQNGL